MKRILYIICVIILLSYFVIPLPVHADCNDEIQHVISGQINDAFAENDVGFEYDDISGLSLSDTANLIKDRLLGEITAPFRLLTGIIAVVVFTAVMQSAGESFISGNSVRTYDLICVTASAALIIPQLVSLCRSTLDVIEQTGSFLLVYVPAFSGITILSGGTASGSLYNVMILAASEFIVKLCDSFLLPMMSVTAVMAVSGSIFPDASMNGFCELIKKSTVWILGIAVTLFTGFVTLKCTLTTKADGAATKAVKMMISGFVPVAGGAVSDAYTSVRSSIEVIRGTVGVGGAIAAAVILLPPILKIAVFRFVMWLGTAAADLFSADVISKLIKGLESVLAIAQSILICYGLMFIICTAILMQSFV